MDSCIRCWSIPEIVKRSSWENKYKCPNCKSVFSENSFTGEIFDVEVKWFDIFEENRDLLNEIEAKLSELDEGFIVYPPRNLRYRAFDLTPFKQVKVVILGQDPYNGRGQANGLAFSVDEGHHKPPSLKNILKEVDREYGCGVPESGDLFKWALQGVLLLNTVLTVQHKTPQSHYGIWERFTDKIIEKVSNKGNVVFMLWGKKAQEKVSLIDTDKNLVLTTSHPSPYSVNRGFSGCGHFKKANEYLVEHGLEPVKWELI